MTPRRFRVILDTCDIVRPEIVQEVWPEMEIPAHSIFDQRHLCKHYPLTDTGTIRHSSKCARKVKRYRTPAPTEPCSICNGTGSVEDGYGTLFIRIKPCERCHGSGEQMKFIDLIPKPKKPAKPKVYPYRRIQEHKSQGDPCALCNQLAAEHRPDRARMKKEREGK
jgi:hypothetical protein